MTVLETIEEYTAEIIAILSVVLGLVSFVIAIINKHKLNKIDKTIEDEVEPDLTEEQKLVVDEYKLQCYKENIKRKVEEKNKNG